VETRIAVELSRTLVRLAADPLGVMPNRVYLEFAGSSDVVISPLCGFLYPDGSDDSLRKQARCSTTRTERCRAILLNTQRA
jgi:hypothetical protein